MNDFVKMIEKSGNISRERRLLYVQNELFVEAKCRVSLV